MISSEIPDLHSRNALTPILLITVWPVIEIKFLKTVAVNFLTNACSIFYCKTYILIRNQKVIKLRKSHFLVQMKTLKSPFEIN